MTLHYLGEMTIKAISEFLGVSQNTVKSRLSRAHANRLRKEEDVVIQQNLGSFQLPDNLAENIMQEVSRIAPVPPAVSKPVAPLAISACLCCLDFPNDRGWHTLSLPFPEIVQPGCHLRTDG